MSWSEYIYLWKPFLQLEHLENRRRLHEHNQYSGGKRYAITRGDVEYSLFTQDISSITLKCAMDFNSFPFDEHTCYYEVSSGDSIEEIDLVYIMRHGHRPWGEAMVTTVLQYKTTFTDIEEDRKQRVMEHFSGYKSTVSYAGFKVTLARYFQMLTIPLKFHC